MGLGGSILVAAIGAILYFATDVSISGFNIATAGLILMIAGVVGAVLSLLAMNRHSRTTTVVQDGSGNVTRRDSRSDTAPL